MKRDALTHPKMLDLASRLNITRAQTIGILTLLFDFTATYATQGDVGKHRDGAIARACDWEGHASEFVDALCESGWLDRSEAYRLLVHDWEDHCEQWVKLKLQKLKLTFVGGEKQAVAIAEPIAEPIAEATAEATAEASASRDPNLAKPSPNLAKPIPPPPSQAKPPNGHAVGLVGGGFFEPDLEEVMRQCLKLDNAIIKAHATAIPADNLWRLGWVSQQLQPGLLADVASKVHTKEIRKPKGYIESALRRECTERGIILASLFDDAPARPRTQVAQ